MTSQVEWSEVVVDVGWGELRGKRCIVGSYDTAPVLRIFGIHGWMDNSNTYDGLIPGLPSGSELCLLDLPGHGYSDHLPDGAYYNVLTYVISVRAALLKLGWNSFALFTHSLGGVIGYFYAALFPKEVSAIISFDSLKYKYESEFLSAMRSDVNTILRYEKDVNSSPIFSEEEAIRRIVKSRMGGPNNDIVNVDEDSARILLARMVKPVSGGLTWRHDRRALTRMKMLFHGYTWSYIVMQIKCPVLYFHPFFSFYDFTAFERRNIFDIFKSKAKSFKCVEVEGAHHVHLTHPHRVLPALTEFLVKLKETTEISQSKL
ncbi:serine hydrolase-like protein isoform X2 [Palaemon carinicauda]|uniref:serine hydrolase-like protein isoform X2 n=1 Tax=Palaemon carinicauda TaxID=392227 RepID=UPI0035B6541B